jgi:heme oxygenase (biliverdin-IX-beta and delta-forming)
LLLNKTHHVQTSPFSQKLRSATTACHKALEANPVAKVLMSPTVTLGAVDHYLKGMYGVVKGFEQSVFPMLENSLPQVNERRKTKLLEANLSISIEEIDRLPCIPAIMFTTQYDTLLKAWGGMYVLEGSTLGGQIISNHLQRVLGEKMVSRTSYFIPYGSQTGSMWKSFLQYFSEAATAGGDEEEIIDSAVQTFSLIDNWLTSASSKNLQNGYSEYNQ